MDEKDALNGISEQVIGAAIDVHRIIGPGLLESAYEACLVFELRDRGFKVEQQKHSRWCTRMSSSTAGIALTL